jgi:lipocalin
MRVGALSIFVASSADVTLYKISSTGCGEATLDAKYESAAISFAGLKEGTCASQGYTVDDGTTTENVPVLGSVVIHKYTKPATMEAVATPVCPPLQYDTVDNFDLKAYVSARWYFQLASPVQYLPTSENFCLQAHYTLKKSRTLLGYDIDVHNYAEEKSGTVHSANICARILDANRGKLEVAPCFLPAFLGGPYFVVAYNETEGYALISGGPPNEPTANGCKTGDGINNAGLWIATRKQQRDEQLVEKVRNIAVSKGFDVSVLNDVDQTNCKTPDNAVVV